MQERGVDPIAADLGLPAAPLLAQPAAATAPPALRKIAVHQVLQASLLVVPSLHLSLIALHWMEDLQPRLLPISEL